MHRIQKQAEAFPRYAASPDTDNEQPQVPVLKPEEVVPVVPAVPFYDDDDEIEDVSSVPFYEDEDEGTSSPRTSRRRSHRSANRLVSAAEGGAPSTYFDGSTQYIDFQGEEYRLNWDSPDQVSVFQGSDFVASLDPDQDWDESQDTGWDYIEYQAQRAIESAEASGDDGSYDYYQSSRRHTASLDWQSTGGNSSQAQVPEGILVVDYESVRGWGYFLHDDGELDDQNPAQDFEVNFNSEDEAKAAAEKAYGLN